jgi:hypothetical protein
MCARARKRTRVKSPRATRSFSSGSICRAHLRVSTRVTAANGKLDLLLLEVDALHGRRVRGRVCRGGGREMRSAGACCAKSCTATPASSVSHTTTNDWLFKKNRYYEIVHCVLNSIHRSLISVAPRFRISPSDCKRARSHIVMAVTCESDNGVFEARGRSEARDAQTSDDEGLRKTLYRLSTNLGQQVASCSRR